MTAPWQRNFGFFMTSLDEHPVSFVVDLYAEPTESHSLRLQLGVPLRGPKGPLLDDLEGLSRRTRLNISRPKTPTPGLYTEFLSPDPRSLQSIANRSLLEQIEATGDAMSVARTGVLRERGPGERSSEPTEGRRLLDRRARPEGGRPRAGSVAVRSSAAASTDDTASPTITAWPVNTAVSANEAVSASTAVSAISSGSCRSNERRTCAGVRSARSRV